MAENLYSSPDNFLINLGYISEVSEQNLILFGHIAMNGVVQVELQANVEKNQIKYALVIDGKNYKKWRLQKWLESKSGLFAKIGLLCFLRVFGAYNPVFRIAKNVKEYAGPLWRTHVEVLSVEQYNKIIAESGSEGWLFKERNVAN